MQLGKTLLAKAVANQTSATFLRVVGSELIQKYLGDGPKLVRELFRVAEEHAPSIVFIDEIDAIGTKRYGVLASTSHRGIAKDSKRLTGKSFATMLIFCFFTLLQFLYYFSFKQFLTSKRSNIQTNHNIFTLNRYDQ